MRTIRLPRARRFAAASLAGVALLAAAACGGDPDIGDVQDELKDAVPEAASSQLPGVEFDTDTLTCPEGQSVESGQEFDCTVEGTSNGTPLVFTLSVTMTGDNEFSWSISNGQPADGSGGTTTAG